MAFHISRVFIFRFNLDADRLELLPKRSLFNALLSPLLFKCECSFCVSLVSTKSQDVAECRSVSQGAAKVKFRRASQTAAKVKCRRASQSVARCCIIQH